MNLKKHLISLPLVLLLTPITQIHAIALPDCTSNGSEINGSFDLPAMSSTTWQLRNQSLVPAWNGVTGPNIEFWRPTFINPVSPNGGNRLEINSDNDGGYFLNFDSAFIPGRQVSLKFEHAARTGTGNDTVQVFVSEGTGVRTLITSQTSTQAGGPIWNTNNSDFIIPNSSYSNMRITFDPTDSGTSSNILDGVVIKSACDYGDAPAGYPSASNSVNNLLYIGSTTRPSFENNDQNSAAANLDDTDDGVSSFPSSTATTNYQVNVDVTNSTGSNATLCGYIDFGQDGGFEGDETICTSVADGATSATLNWPIPLADRNNNGDFVVRLQLTSDVGGANDGEVEDYLVPITTLPITLSSVDSQITSSGIKIDWTTATETNNAGYFIEYWDEKSNQWNQINKKMIPSKVINSLKPQAYSYSINNLKFKEFRILDVNTRGIKKNHGTFKLGINEGVNAVENIKLIDWKTINQENKISQLNTTNLKSSNVLNQALISVETDGIQKFSYDDLVNAGVVIENLKIENIAITDNYSAVARHIEDINHNSIFDSGDSIDFLGKSNSSLYSNQNIYTLSDNFTKAKPAISINTATENPESIVINSQVTFENQLKYSYAARINDPWYDQLLFSNGSAVTLDREFDLFGLHEGDSQLNIKFWGLTDFPGIDQDHHIKIYLNSILINDFWYDGNSDASHVFSIPSGILNETNNILTLEVPGDTAYPFDIQAYDSFSVTYPKLSSMDTQGQWNGIVSNSLPFKVSHGIGKTIAWKIKTNQTNSDVVFSDAFELEAERMVGLNNTELKGKGEWFIADSRSWHKPEINPNIPDIIETTNNVDYLIVAHPLFINSQPMESLIALQESRGYSTIVTNIESIYAQFSDFTVSPQAIKEFIKQVNPQFVLLVGADSIDYHNYMQLDGQSFIPTFYNNNNVISFTPTDHSYADYYNDGIMHTSIGRLPVRTINEFDLMVNKLIVEQIYNSTLLVSGPSEDGNRYETQTMNNSLHLPNSINQSLISSDALGSTEAYTELANQLNGSPKLINYLGHSSYSIWGLSRTNAVLDNNTVTNLTNSSPHTILQWACWNTYFVNPEINTMSELLLIQANGASNVFGATALTELSLINHYNQEFYKQLIQSITLGEMIKNSNNKLMLNTPFAVNAILGFALLGDPAARIH